jgi:ABC-type siderophore export system fused ATPase/permease subunit
LLAEQTNASQNVLNIVRLELHYIGLNLARLGAWVVVKGLVVCSAYSEDSFMSINLIAEVNIVNFVSVALVHVPLSKEGQNVLRSIDSKLGKDSKELHLADVSTVGDIEILELRLQVDATVLNNSPVFLDNLSESLFLLFGTLEVLASGSNGVLTSHRLD